MLCIFPFFDFDSVQFIIKKQESKKKKYFFPENLNMKNISALL